MGQLCIYLPPFASDYSGVCSAIFDLDCMTAINDAACCTSHYVFYDEPRWSGNVRPVFSTALRNIDAILGNDNEIIRSICEAADSIDTEMTAVIGTPVPAITGMDMVGLAGEIEYKTGKPAFGFNTTGFAYYDKGIIQAGKALIDRFAEPLKPVKGRVNIVGMTPLDFGINGNDRDLTELLEESGRQTGCCFFMGLTLSDIRACASAELNLAVSSAGLVLAKYLNRKFGIPYKVGFPIGTEYAEYWVLSLESGSVPQKSPVPENHDEIQEGRLLVVSDQVLGNSLRSALRLAGISCQIDVASFFGWDTDIAEPEDIHLKDEAHYLRLLKSGSYFAIAGDPMLMDVPPAEDLIRLELVHPAVSSKLGWNKAPRLSDDRIINSFVELLSKNK